jgi:hypothetical protein
MRASAAGSVPAGTDATLASMKAGTLLGGRQGMSCQ